MRAPNGVVIRASEDAAARMADMGFERVAREPAKPAEERAEPKAAKPRAKKARK
ncbi:MAG: hypothetical protein IJ092_03165 [Atopobiaceae bacterium]|nr:hypothetical protein [Atopobiaceae bacterium]